MSASASRDFAIITPAQISTQDGARAQEERGYMDFASDDGRVEKASVRRDPLRQPSTTSPKSKKHPRRPSTGVMKRTPPKPPRYRSVSAPVSQLVAPAPPRAMLAGTSSNAPIELDATSDDEPASTPLPAPRQSPKANPPVTPVSKARSVSYPTLSPAGTPSQSINAAIGRLIRKEVGISDTRGKTGFVYVLAATHKNGRRLVKIGHTADGDVDKRRKSIERTCSSDIRFPPPSTTDHHHHHQQIKTYYKLVEQLAHLELRDRCYPIDCACRKRHREYFAVDENVAHRVVRHWIRFCEQRPWRDHPYSFLAPGPQAKSAISQAICPTTTGPIKPEWLDRLERQHSMSVDDVSAATTGLEVRLAHWDAFVSPSLGAWLWYDLRQAWAGLWRCAWEVCCVLQGLRILWLTWDWDAPPWVGLLVVVVSLVCTLRKVGEIRSAAACWLSRRLVGFVSGERESGFLPLATLLSGCCCFFLRTGVLPGWPLRLDDPGALESRREPEIFVGAWVTTDGEDNCEE
ncbi:T5orf172 domain-containing protein [Chaetomium strumarium]|uniref:T5orf172 domain-containing protein n=1 Tax=Chaetomium strumarium TaxID=1170767 RepID=A0AAJ0M6E8_9PEZI|nr:T5orf172 domain-containing protein [Chaetomium strumarium]